MRLHWMLCCCLLLLTGCSRKFFTKEISPEALAGTWRQAHAEVVVKPGDFQDKGPVLTLFANGRFEARSIPFARNLDAFQYVNDSGRWLLEDHPADEGRARWKLTLIMENHRAQVEWNLIDSGGPVPLLAYMYNVESDADAEDALVLTKSVSKSTAPKPGPAQ